MLEKSNDALNPAALAQFIENGWSLLPLYKPFATSTDKRGRTRKDGKRPLHNNWTKRTYDSAKVVKQYGGVNNIGVQLRDEDLVIDVDPRNGGKEGFAKLCKRLGLKPDNWPHVITGSGGSHYYLKKPEDVKVVDTLPAYPGVEFKSKGRQVVAPGSLHPDTRKLYYWDEFGGLLENAPECPAGLLDAITRPEAPNEQGEAGDIAPHELAGMLAALDPEEFREQDRWLELMMACHHASSGEARQEFIDWSTGDPKFADYSDIIGRRWDSLHTDRGSERVVTKATLYKALKDAGHGDKIPQDHGDPNEDFNGNGSLAAEFDTAVSILDRGLTVNARAEAKDTIANAYIAVHKSGIIPAYDEFRRGVVFKGSELPWNESYGRELSDETLRMVRMFLVQRYQGNAYTPSKDNVHEAVRTIAFGNKFDPVNEYLAEAQSKWDGTARAATLFASYFNCGDSDYVRAVSLAFMIGAVRRPRKPGSKFDTMPIIKSAQGWNKSTGIKALFGADFFSDAHLGDLRSKDAAMLIRGIWALEFAELEGLNRADSNTLKAFMSRATDRVRDPFNVVVSNVPRRGVFIGTANEGGFLKDMTGGRRFWPLTLQAPVNVAAIIADRDQLWGEAATLEAQGASDVLPEHLWKVAAKHQRAETAVDPWLDELRSFLEDRAANYAFGERDSEAMSWPPGDRVHTRELLEALGLKTDRQNIGQAQRLRVLMESSVLNWRYKESLRVRGRVGPGYVSPDFVERKRM